MPALSTSLLFSGLALCTPAVNDRRGGGVLPCHRSDPRHGAIEPRLRLRHGNRAGGKQQNITETGFTETGFGGGCAPGVCAPGWFAEEESIAFPDGSAVGPARYCEVVIDPADMALTVDFEIHVDGQVVYQANEQALGTCPPKRDPGHATGRP